MNLQSTVETAPVPEWVFWAATVAWFSFLFFALSKRDKLNVWLRYYVSRRQSRKWQKAGNLERREIIRPGRWM